MLLLKYDLQEWDKPKPSDLGIGCPKPPPDKSKEEEDQQGICMRCGQVGKCFTCKTCTVINCGALKDPNATCTVCGTPRQGGNAVGRLGRREESEPVKADQVVYNGVLFNRPFDPYSEEPHPHNSETWAVELLKGLLLSLYPPMPPNAKMQYSLLFPEKITPENANKIYLLGCDEADKPEATWKLVVSLRSRKMILAYNLVSHGRRVFRQLVYTSDCRYTLHNLPLKVILHFEGLM
jgi:hypothetical protein